MAGIKSSYHQHNHYFPDQTKDDYYQGPNFDFPKLSTASSSTFHQIKDTVATTAKTLITDTSVKDAAEQNLTSILTNNGTNLDEGLAKINNTLTGLMENTNSSVVTDVFQKNDTLDVATSDNATLLNVTDGKGSGLFTTTENIFNYITNATNDLVTPTAKGDENHNLTMSHQGSDNYEDNYQTTYIIMGVIIAILLIVIGVIAYFYVTHKKKNVVAMRGQYTTGTKRDTQHYAVQNLESPENDSFKC